MFSSLNPLLILDFIGVAVFAATGALAASRKGLDIVGFIFLAAITGIGGGTFRDLILGKLPVFWIEQPLFIGVCVLVALLIFFTAHLFESRYRLLLWCDALGLAAYCVMGTLIGLSQGISPYAAIVTGVMTATFGGIFRDVIAGEESVLLSDEIYVSAALLGATSVAILMDFNVNKTLAICIGVALAFALRAAASLCDVARKPKPLFMIYNLESKVKLILLIF